MPLEVDRHLLGARGTSNDPDILRLRKLQRSVASLLRETGEQCSGIRQLVVTGPATLDPVALVEPINAAQEERAAAQVDLAHVPGRPGRLDAAAVYAMIDSLGDVTRVLHRAELDELTELYAALRLEMTYHHEDRAIAVSVSPTPVGVSACVRGGT